MSNKIDLEQCQKKGFVKNSEKAKGWVKKELDVAQRFLESTKFVFKSQQYESTVIMGYLVLFHLNRALVYNKGKIVKTHICVVFAVKELYSNNKDILEMVTGAENALISRNQIQYDGYNANKEMAEFILSLAEDYFGVVKKLLNF